MSWYRAEPQDKLWRSLLTGRTVLWDPDDYPDPEGPVAPPPPTGSIEHGTDLRVEDVGLTDESALVTVNGPIQSSRDNEIIENRRVVYWGDRQADNAIHITHKGVTVRNCKIEHDYVANGLYSYPGASGLTIENCYFDGMSPYYGTGRDDANFGNRAIELRDSAVVRRNYFTGIRSGVATRATGGVQVVENWVNDLHQHAHKVSGSSFNFRGWLWGGENPPEYLVARNRAIAGSSAGINMYPSDGPIRNVRFVDNLVIGVPGEHTGFGLRGGFGGYRGTPEHYCNNRNIRIEGNRFEGEFGFPDALGEGTNAAVNVNQTGNTFVNNRWMPGYGTIEGDLPARCGISQDACEGECP